MVDKWDRSSKDEFNQAANGKQQESNDRRDKGSEQIKNNQLGLKDGPPPPKGPGMATVRQQHREAMAKDHQRATGKTSSPPAKTKSDKKTPQKGDLKKDFDRSR